MNKLLNSNIALLNKVYKDKLLNPINVVQACFEKIEKTKYLNAYVTLTKNEGLEQAKESQQRFENNKSLGILDGVPIAVKDNFCTENIRTTCASKMLENFISPYNATVYDRLRKQGAVLIGKTNMDEFAMGSGTTESIFGPTRSVYGDRKHPENFCIAGGSSGGSAVAVASGTCFAALASDSGGSVRNPAAYNAIIGLKPTYGLLSRHGLIPLAHSMDCPGIMTRTVNDCVILLNAIAGPDVKDSTCRTKNFQQMRLPSNPSMKGLKIGIPKEYNCDYLTDDVLEAWNYTANILEDAGADVFEVSLPHTKYSFCCYTIINACEVSSNFSIYDGIEFGYRATDAETSTKQLYSASRSLAFNEVVKKRIMTGNFLLLNENKKDFLVQAAKVRRLISNDFDNVFENVHVLLTPTIVCTAPKYNEFIKLDNQDQCAALDYCTTAANMAGIPAITLPVTYSTNQLPISMQLMGPNYSERVLLTIAKFLERNINFQPLKLEM